MNKAIYVALLSSIFIGFSTVIGSQAAKVANPLVMIAYSTLISVFILYVIFSLFHIKADSRRMIKKYPNYFIATVISRPLLGSLLLAVGWSMVPAIRAVFVVRLEPIFVILIGYIVLRNKITTKNLFLSLVLLIGAYLFLTSGAEIFKNVGLGDIILISALIPLSYSYISSAKILKDFTPQSLFISMNIVGGLILLVIAFLLVPNEMVVSTQALYLILGHAILFNVLGLGLWFVALKYVEEWIVASILSLTPISGALLAFFWLHDTLNYVQIVGGVVMILATFLIARASKKSIYKK